MAVEGPLTNKIAIITGSGKENGIGAAIALTLARAGARVTINHVSDSSAARAVEVVSTIEAAAGKGSVISIQADVSTPEGTKRIVEGTLSGFKVDHIDIIAAMDQLTFTLSREIGREGKGITINTIAPGPVDTDSVPAGDSQSQAMKQWLISLTRAEDRIGTVNDIADAVLLLADEKSRWITGQYISASGGIV
ncbi:hypothetical protein J3F84DRAFT_394499 [Trichoderma pleuroticola]